MKKVGLLVLLSSCAMSLSAGDSDEDAAARLFTQMKQAEQAYVNARVDKLRTGKFEAFLDTAVALEEAQKKVRETAAEAVQSKNLKRVKTFVQADQSEGVDFQYYEGDTLLHLAAASLAVDVVRMLLETYSANINVRNNAKKTPYDLVVQAQPHTLQAVGDRKEILRLLERYRRSAQP